MIGLVRMGGGVMCAVCSDIPLWSVVMIGVCSGLDWPEISDSHISFPPKAYMYLSVVFNSTQKLLLHEISFFKDGRMMAKCVGHEFNESGQNMAVIGELVWGNHYHHHPSVWVEMRGIDGSLLDWARWSNHHNHHSHHHTHHPPALSITITELHPRPLWHVTPLVWHRCEKVDLWCREARKVWFNKQLRGKFCIDYYQSLFGWRGSHDPSWCCIAFQ